MTFYIYEVPGHKNGATKNWKSRSKSNFNRYHTQPILIETIEGPDIEDFWQLVGDREWELADQNGYKRGEHYRSIRLRASVGQPIGAIEGGRVAGRKHVESGHWEQCRKNSFSAESKAKRADTRRRKAIANYKLLLQQLPNEFKTKDAMSLMTKRQFDGVRIHNLVIRKRKGLYTKA